MSKRDRTVWSQETTDEPPSQMPRYSQSQRSYASSYSVPMRYNRNMAATPYRRKRYYKSRVPRAISTRGTPSGYYELPVKVFWKLYVNTATGAWVTDPVTGVQSGAAGYPGMAISFDYSQVYIDLGNNSFAANIAVNIPGVTDLQSVFDLCKIYRVDYEFWWTNGLNQSPTATGAAGAPELWVANDQSGAFPPGSQTTVLQYSDVTRIVSDPSKRVTKITYPRQRVYLGTTTDPTGNSGILGGSQVSSYFETDKPSVRHSGLIGFFNLPQNQTTSQMYYLNCMMTMHRRFRTTR